MVTTLLGSQVPRDTLEQRCMGIVLQLISQAGLGIKQDCLRYTTDFIRDGLSKLPDQVEFDDAEKAESNLRAFIDEMIAEARNLNSDMLSEQTFYRAKDSLCPLWPFC